LTENHEERRVTIPYPTVYRKRYYYIEGRRHPRKNHGPGQDKATRFDVINVREKAQETEGKTLLYKPSQLNGRINSTPQKTQGKIAISQPSRGGDQGPRR